ncbi:hypothetical protein [Fretibacterium sp. OH1220_COT-178]|uniref:hypothetical protein n=1 Tax=Fretibacterium sp. OH1220_COT-178 TaxID=2491047 RepID=UPI000F5DDB97|nr:hypothetical protein [Fretibacterium sp. OH1220_COT-178]RRD63858.1 hypothetical protein EII26_09410 [Fretibacterium sp. OH1220_COT-178]
MGVDVRALFDLFYDLLERSVMAEQGKFIGRNRKNFLPILIARLRFLRRPLASVPNSAPFGLVP